MRLLVTGGAGFIGSHVVDQALAAGWEVGVLDDLSTGRREQVPPSARFFPVDIRDRSGVDAAFSAFRPTAVAHFAALASVSISVRDPRLNEEINAGGSRNVLAAAQDVEARRFVFASTGGAMYGDVPVGRRAGLDWPTKPGSPYAESKLAFERQLAAAKGPATTSLRLANVYGPRQDSRGEAGVVAIFAERLRRGEPITLYGRERAGDEGCIRDYVHVSDVVRAAMAALNGNLEPPIVHVASGIGTSTRELSDLVQRLLGVRAQVIEAPPRPGDVGRSVLEPAAPGLALEPGLRATLLGST